MTSHVLSSATNIAVFVAVAGSQSVAVAARFSLFYTAWVLFAAFCRMLFLEPLLRSAYRGQAFRKSIRILAGIATFASLLSFIAGIVRADHMWLLVATGIPFLVAVDAARYIAFSVSSPGVAVRLDLIWFVVSIALVGMRDDLTGAEPFFGIWAAGAAGTLLANHRSVRATFRAAVGESGAKLGSIRLLIAEGGNYLVGYILSAGSTLGVLYALAIVATEAEVVTYRVALTVAGIVNVGTAAVYAVAVPSLSKAADGREKFSTVGYSVLIAGCTVVGLLLVPRSLGVAAFGESWSQLYSFRLLVAVYFVLKALEIPYVSRFRGNGFPEVVMRGRGIYGLALLAGMPIVLIGEPTAERAFFVATAALCLPLIYWWRAIARARYRVLVPPMKSRLL